MVRRFYIGPKKVTALRVHTGEWVINEIADTVRTATGFWDKPGKYLGTASKTGRGGKEQWIGDIKDGPTFGYPTLASAVEGIVGWGNG